MHPQQQAPNTRQIVVGRAAVKRMWKYSAASTARVMLLLMLVLLAGGAEGQSCPSGATNCDGAVGDWDVSLVTDMRDSESSVRSLLLLLLLVVGRGVLSSVYTSLSPRLGPAVCSSLIGVPPSLSSSPLTLLVSSAPSSSYGSVLLCPRLQPGPVLVERRQGHGHVCQ